MSILTFLDSLPEVIANFWTNIFNHNKAAFQQLEITAQDALTNGSGIIAALQNNPTAEAALADIEAKFGVPAADVSNVLKTLAKTFNLGEEVLAGNDTAITAVLQSYIHGLHQSVWADICNAAADIAASVLNGGTPISIGMSVVKYVYLDIVKPLFFPATPAPATQAPPAPVEGDQTNTQPVAADGPDTGIPVDNPVVVADVKKPNLSDTNKQQSYDQAKAADTGAATAG